MAALTRFIGFLKPLTATHSLITRYSCASANFHSDVSFHGRKPGPPTTSIIPHAPKRPTSAYTLYIKERMADLRKENAMSKVTEIMTAAAAEWKKMPQEERQKYEDMHAKLKEAYKLKKEEWDEKVTSVQLEQMEQAKLLEKEEKIKRKIKKINRDRERVYSLMGKPKRPPHSFNLFLKERLTLGTESPKEILIKAGKEWKTKTEEEKRPYVEKAKILSKKYKAESQAWLEKRDEADKVFEIEQAKKNEHSVKPKSEKDK
uniref:HMG box domain-containing protein n=1 Tax=Strigamia maritima TaxID=126957 RepID=T1IWX7_STRMM